MNDHHPSGTDSPDVPTADSWNTQGYDTGTYAATGFDTAIGQYGTGQYDTGQYDTSYYATATTTTAQWDGYDGYDGSYDPGTGTFHTDSFTTGTFSTGVGYDTGGYDVSAAWDTRAAGIPRQPGPEDADYGYPAASPTATGEWDASGWSTTPGLEYDHTGSFDSAAYDATAFSTYGTGAYDTTGYDSAAPAWDTGEQLADAFDPARFDAEAYAAPSEYPGAPVAPDFSYDTAGVDASGLDTTAAWDFAELTAEDAATTAPADIVDLADPEHHERPEPDPLDKPGSAPEPDTEAAALSFSALESRSRSRRRTPKRSALLTVAVPSIAVVGVAGIAAATVSGGVGDDGKNKQPQAAPDPSEVQPSAANNKLDTQLSGLSEDAGDFAGRASRTQERIDLKERQEAERKKKIEEAKRKEALRPKFALPVAEHGLSALYGQAGVNWMSVHSGIDFPVSYGTPVKAATDGTVSTKWGGSFGNMVIVTAKDGTETWYCHLSSARIQSGEVKAGDTIAYSGNSGNSTGPHLHFEVHPGGGDAIDPLGWLQAKGLNPQ
ncbi:M23 family metallopeptidase [Streptomyces boninensis]|uniref:M23 family metallopeptidase n=1 Tax=Streptomyces boninensis TaxID=2039455 RepID=UPI003B21A62D